MFAILSAQFNLLTAQRDMAFSRSLIHDSRNGFGFELKIVTVDNVVEGS